MARALKIITVLSQPLEIYYIPFSWILQVVRFQKVQNTIAVLFSDLHEKTKQNLWKQKALRHGFKIKGAVC